MIIFLYGQDSYRAKKKLDEVIEHYKEVHKSGLNLVQLDVKEIDFKAFINNFKVISMFDEKKLIILKNAFSDKDFQEDFLEDFKNLKNAKDIIVIYEKDKVDERSKLFKVLKKEAKCQEFDLLQGAMLKKWIEQEFEKYGAKISLDAENLLLEFAGNDLWKLGSEIKKLSDYKGSTLIKREDIELHVRPKIENDIFKTIDSLASNNKKQALDFLHKHLEGGDSPLYLLSMISYQFKNLLIIRELVDQQRPYADIVKSSGLHPFVVKKIYYMCGQFPMAQLKKIYQKIFQVDSDIKIGKIEPETALDLLVSEI